ncbi:MAG TPA: TetR/AcrR family transcriptional regulator [Pseudonocardiaceae bacterium]|nr:TetR/AcrR family transcriptional regulator [Pseudonocardiaceae bacterium]
MRARKFACTQVWWHDVLVGLRERKKQATREALREAALRLALERGVDNVRVDEIADAAGVSPRTYNNYFASREQAIVAAVTAEREARVAAAVAARPAGVGLADAVVDAVVEQYTDPGEGAGDALLLITGNSALRAAFVETAGGMESSLAGAIAGRVPGMGERAARVLAASVAAAVRVGLGEWLPGGGGGFVVVSGSLPELLRGALEPLRPALDAAG